MPTKRTITRDSVFGRTPNREEAATVQQGVKATDSPTRQTAVWLADEEVEWLDMKIREVKKGGWRSLSRSALIRALIRASMEQDPALAGVSGEAELLQRLLPK